MSFTTSKKINQVAVKNELGMNKKRLPAAVKKKDCTVFGSTYVLLCSLYRAQYPKERFSHGII